MDFCLCARSQSRTNLGSIDKHCALEVPKGYKFLEVPKGYKFLEVPKGYKFLGIPKTLLFRASVVTFGEETSEALNSTSAQRPKRPRP